MSKQAEIWGGKFGVLYTDRNKITWQEHFPLFKNLLNSIHPIEILEIGCNRGHNLEALARLFGKENRFVGIDVNQHALDIAKTKGLEVYLGDGITLPFEDASFDLVFTKGVLIHILPSNLFNMMKEIYRVSRQYISFIEYFSNEETPIDYRGHTDLLWKNNFSKIYLNLFPDLRVLNQRCWAYGDYFQERTDGVLLEKGDKGDFIR